MLKIVAIAAVSSLAFLSLTVSNAQENVAANSAIESIAVEKAAVGTSAPEGWAVDGYEDR
jgi:hypothetical protein